MADFEFSGDSLEALARDLRESALQFRARVDKEVAEIAAEIVESAKAIAGQHSSTIPGTIKMRMVPGAAVITAGSEDVALAALYELGNRGKGGGKSGEFKHPVFGHAAWVSQRRYPFLRPALAVDRKAITKRMESAWSEALGPLLRRE